MPNEITVSAVTAISGASENPAEPNAEPFIPPSHGPPAPSASPIPNPQMRLDPALGLVVIEFRDANGAVTTSIPSQRQLNAYRMWEQNRATPVGPRQLPQVEGNQSAAAGPEPPHTGKQ